MFENKNAIELTHCLACGSKNLKFIIDLNDQPLANSYKTSKEEKQETFPLAINHCKDCFHVQLTHAVNPDLLFRDYLYVSGTTKTMGNHFNWFSRFSCEYYSILNQGKMPSNVFDIGCNDGSQLNYYKNMGLQTHGVDPATNLYEISSKSHQVYLNYFDDSFLDVLEPNTRYNIIIAQNVFAHNYNPLSFLNTAKKLMDNDTLMFIQTSQADMIKNNEFDTIYHEHISFYNINSMNELCRRANLNLIDVIKCPLHGNSYIFIISKKVNRNFHIENLIDMERKIGLLSDRTYEEYAIRCKTIVNDLINIVDNAREMGYAMIGYGAAAKGMTLLNYGNINLDYIIDDNPLKQNRFTPGTNIPIVSSDILKKFDEDDKIFFIPLAWNFFKEICSRIEQIRNGKNDLFVTYFPEVAVNK